MKAIKLLLMCLMVCLSSSSLFAIDDGVFFTVNGLTYEKASSAAAQTSNDVKVYMGNYSGAITIPATVTYNGQTCNVVEIGSYCFENCNLTSISIGSKVRYINDCAFSGCSISNGITIPSTVTTIAYNAFRNTKLTSLTIPSTAKFDMRNEVEFSGSSLVTLNIEVTNLTQLSSLTCSNLKNLSLSSGKLPSSSRFNCPKLETLSLNHSAKLAMTSSEWPSTSYVPAPEKIILYVPSGLVNSYKSDSFWQRFGAITNVGDTTKPLILQASTTSKTLNAGENFTLSYYMAPSGSASVSYTSSNTSVATVTSAGKVTAVAAGTATITIKAGSKSATCVVTVAHTHSYGAPTWTWATNGKSASAKFTCTANDDTQTKSATITSAVKTPATCTTMGTTTYTAKVTFNNTQYTSTKNVQDIAALGHDFSTSSECSVCHTHNTYALADGTAYTKAEQIDNVDVTYSRSFSTTNWQALYVPFEIDYDLIKEELEVGRINAFYQYDDDEDGDPDRFSLEFFKMKDGATLRANYPYLVKAKTTGKKTFTFENVTLHKAESNFIDCATVDTRFILTGVYEIFTSTNDDTYSISNGIIGNLPQGNRINAMRWYITLEDRTGMANISKAKARTIDLVEGSYNEESETTSITAYSISSANAIYNMNGVYVGSATESTIADVIKELPCGIYIYRGHKYIINK